jgi:hypothetical protein
VDPGMGFDAEGSRRQVKVTERGSGATSDVEYDRARRQSDASTRVSDNPSASAEPEVIVLDEGDPIEPIGSHSGFHVSDYNLTPKST